MGRDDVGSGEWQPERLSIEKRCGSFLAFNGEWATMRSQSILVLLLRSWRRKGKNIPVHDWTVRGDRAMQPAADSKEGKPRGSATDESACSPRDAGSQSFVA
jgi:hypothetical protein